MMFYYSSDIGFVDPQGVYQSGAWFSQLSSQKPVLSTSSIAFPSGHSKLLSPMLLTFTPSPMALSSPNKTTDILNTSQSLQDELTQLWRDYDRLEDRF
ncbi:hypothetical protein GOP47_0021403 [Adiantum capillus-veneris]|uniref:Uncharacterized protein n=1 Tax=Adiantum capillus-veneris TaxID=13818 RepID=A0A9D4U7C3_ADICA|nr:hypothetical protein GOP47_0021403 [Adiantum capillus-veneris]